MSDPTPEIFLALQCTSPTVAFRWTCLLPEQLVEQLLAERNYTNITRLNWPRLIHSALPLVLPCASRWRYYSVPFCSAYFHRALLRLLCFVSIPP
jgi:hypothetical protein